MNVRLSLRALAALLLMPAWPALVAAQTYPPELPPPALVRIAIDDSPEVRAAIAMREAALAERRRLVAGPDEWTGAAGYQRRRARSEDGVRHYPEWELALERRLRSPRKARLDRRLGDERQTEAAAALAEARHEASRLLLQLWYGWLREDASARILRGQATLVGREAGAVARREQLGDASRLDRIQGEGEHAQARAAARLAEERARRAEIVLRNRFPGLSVPHPPALPAPSLDDMDPATLAQTAVEENHGVRVARAAAERSRVEGLRALAERRPDPTAGVRYGTELGGADRMLGVYVSIPLPGEARRAASDAALAQADALAAQADAAYLEANALVRSLQEAVHSGQDRWRAAEQAAGLQEQAAERMATSHRLGQSSFAEVLLARRQALGARMAATEARVDALENRARLLLDAHALWDFDAPGSAGY